MDLIFLVGNIATFVTIVSSFSGLPTCRDILKRKSTSGVSCLPFVTAVINCSLWLHYGMTVQDFTVTMVNLIALFLQSCYLTTYYYVTSDKATLTQKLLPTALVLLFVHGYCCYSASREEAASLLGILSCCGSIVVSAAPLAGIKEVFRTKSTASLPLPIILGIFVVSALWFFYGFLNQDSYIQVPNFIASVISGFQLSLFLIFDSKAAEKKFD